MSPVTVQAGEVETFPNIIIDFHPPHTRRSPGNNIPVSISAIQYMLCYVARRSFKLLSHCVCVCVCVCVCLFVDLLFPIPVLELMTNPVIRKRYDKAFEEYEVVEDHGDNRVLYT